MTIAITLQAVTTHAQTAPEVWVRGMPGLSDTIRIELSRASQPIWHQLPVDSQEKSFADILEDVCGTQPDATKEFLKQQMLQLNAASSIQDQALPGEYVAVPFCLKFEENAKITVQPNDTPLGILKRESGIATPGMIDAFYSLNKSEHTYKTMEDFEKRLQIGDQITLPYVAPERPFVANVGTHVDINNIVAMNAPSQNFENIGLASGLQGAFIRPASRGDLPLKPELSYVESIVFSDIDAAGMCGSPLSKADVNLNANGIIARYELERKAKLELFHEDVAPATAGLVDSGVGAVGDGFFDIKLFSANRSEWVGEDNVDDDDNEHVDDFYGFNLFTGSGSILPSPMDEHMAHGTQMAALMLGGKDGAAYWTQHFERPPVQLKVINFTMRHSDGRVRPALPDQLQTVINYLRGQDAKTINLSLAGERGASAIRNIVQDNDEMTGIDAALLVVAAGNRQGGGKNLQTVAVYPAFFGGRESRRTMTVGAYDLSGARAKFSNYSPENVDLLSPGCLVPTRTTGGDDILDSGTSPATATVSFAASLIRSLGLPDAAKIKNRLLAGTDFDPKLANDAWSSGRLNILKAISLYHDVIELRDASVQLQYGIMKNPENLMAFCKEPPLQIPIRRVRKLVPNQSREGEVQMDIWFDTDGKLQREPCVQTNSEGSIGTFQREDGQTIGPALQDVKELVFGSFVKR